MSTDTQPEDHTNTTALTDETSQGVLTSTTLDSQSEINPIETIIARLDTLQASNDNIQQSIDANNEAITTLQKQHSNVYNKYKRSERGLAELAEENRQIRLELAIVKAKNERLELKFDKLQESVLDMQSR